MRKSLLVIAAMCSVSFSAFAQSENMVDLNNEVKDIEDVATEMVMDHSWVATDIDAAEEVATPIVSIIRPSGVFLCGYLQKRNSQLTVPYAKAPAYAPLTWSISKEDWSGNTTANGEYTLAVPNATTLNDTEALWLTSEGENITSSLIPMANSFYPAPYASCTVSTDEATSVLLPQYTSSSGAVNDPKLTVGGSLPYSSTYGYAMASNYSAAWAGSNSSHTGYGTFNTVSSNWNSKLSATDATPVGIAETFGQPASPYILGALNAHFSFPTGAVAGTMKARVRKCTLSASGALKSLGEVIATATQETYTSTGSATWIIYNFDKLCDAQGEEISYVVIDSPILVEIYCADETTNIKPMYKSHTDYFDGEYHAYTIINYTEDEEPKTTYASTNFKWSNSSTGTVSYQSSFMIGMKIIYPYIEVVDANGAPVAEDKVEIVANGGSKTLTLSSYYNDSEYVLSTEDGLVEFTYDYINKCWESSADWLKVATVSQINESKKYTGKVELTVELSKNNTGEPRNLTLVAETYGAKKKINITQESVSTAINEVSTAENGKMYNIAGQQVDKNYKGVVICNGVKSINK